ncbi:MAG: ribose-phosphate pyrophosphokinase [Pseudomonadota bacterium]|jgi:ribose-phosphate pyrophosphokinase|nr:ribose-phosphate pyrophosphokinase [Pseudomonadota bacterium]MEC8956055.1 ribose-phosphate pyrophosphokinase [Pseudomonadota bacterium]
MAIISGNAHPKLAQDIAKVLHLPLTKAQVDRFSDGEFNVEILENIRGREAFIIQSTSPPSAENLMELLVMADACRRASAVEITAVIPYFGFARQDRRPRSSRVPITAKLVSKLIAAAGIDRVLTVDLHAEQIQGFFDIAVDNVYASPILLGDAWKKKHANMVVVSPDVGGVVRGRALAKRLDNADLVIIDKRRSKANKSEVMNIIGDVEEKNCIMIDDMVDTAGTLCHAADKLKDSGASSVHAYITHPVLSGPAVQRISDSAMDEIVVTDTIPLSKEAKACSKIRQLSIAELLAETMRRISDEESVSSLFLE